MTQRVVDADKTKESRSRTKYEAFTSRDGILKLTEHFALKAPRCRYGSSELVLIRSRNTRSHEVFIALRIEFEDTGDYPQRGASLLDEDELVSLASALKYMTENRKMIVEQAQTYTEVNYSSRGGFSAGIYVEPATRKTGEFMNLDGISAFLVSLNDLAASVDEALFKIEVLRDGAQNSLLPSPTD
jgi:hypothetical protein